MKLEPYLTPCTKTTSKHVKDLNLRGKTTKPLEENIGENLQDIGADNGFVALMPKAKATDGKIDKFDFIKVKKFCASTDNNKQVKR